MAVDPTTLNPAEQIDQWTSFILAPVCLLCGHGGLSRRRDGQFRCDRCQRRVLCVEYAPERINLPPQEAPFRRSSLIRETEES